MRRAIMWAKANPITVIAVAMVPAAMVILVFVQLSGSTFKADIGDEQKSIKRLESLKRSRVEIPSENPEEPMRSESFTITKAAIDKMARIRDRMDHEYEQIKQWSTRHNRGDDRPYPHRPMIEGLFPHPAGHAGKEYDAQAAYKRALYEFTRPVAEGEVSAYPRMNAGRSLMLEDVELKIAQFLEDQAPVETTKTGGTGMGGISEDEFNELRDKAYARMIGLVRDHASRIHIYANTPVPNPHRDGDYLIGKDTPFHVGEWALGGDKPTMAELWEAQVDLWIQQDIVEAIATANRSDDPVGSVLTAPVKRLLKIEIEPGYVGRTSKGLVPGYKRENVKGSTVTARGNTRPGRGGMMGAGAMGMMGMGGPMGPGGSYGGPRPGMGGPPGMMHASPMGGYGRGMHSRYSDDEDTSEEGESGQTDDFSLTPTGRRSNAIYDVRHATVKVVIDSRRIPEFLQILSEVNFNTALLTSIKDIDEYAHLSGSTQEKNADSSYDGGGVYVYGPNDAVELEVVLETIWLRSWTAGDTVDPEGEAIPADDFNPGLMPDGVRETLGLKRRDGGEGADRHDEMEEDE